MPSVCWVQGRFSMVANCERQEAHLKIPAERGRSYTTPGGVCTLHKLIRDVETLQLTGGAIIEETYKI